MSLYETWVERLAGHRQRVVLTDGDDPRAVVAAHTMQDVVEPILVRSEGTPEGAEDLTIIDPGSNDPIDVGLRMVRDGEADACVAGATRPTADVARAVIDIVGTLPEVRTISSSFLFEFPDHAPIAYADCGVVINPTATQLAHIAITTADTYATLTGLEPKVAMLSHSTFGSSSHAVARKVRTATERAAELDPDLVIDGELQFDAAFVPDVAALKAPGSAVAGAANVFVFPNLDAANIAYKITERLAGRQALGPLLQGVAHPVHDLSRGCSVDDIVKVAVIAALQAHELEERTR